MTQVESYTFNSSNREDLSDIIYNISPTETPFVSAAARGSASNRKHEWQVDELAAAALNINVEGADYTGEVRDAPDRIFNYTQISSKPLTVSGTQEAIVHAGRKSELAYQLAKQGLEIRRDMEYQMLSFASAADVAAIPAAANPVDGGSFPIHIGSASTERVAGSVATWIFTNTERASDATAIATSNNQPASDDVVEAGTARAFLESYLKEAIRRPWVEGGNPEHIFVDAFNKQMISQFTGGTTKFDDSSDKRLVTAIDIYVSDFGEHMVIPDRFLLQPGATGTDGVSAYVLDMDYWCIAYLRPFMQENLAKTGDAENRLLLAEWTLESKNEKASAIVSDLLDA